AHGVHLGMAGGTVAAGGVDFFHNDGSRAKRQTAAAVLLRDKRGEISGFGQCRDELRRIGAVAVERAPIFAGKPRAQLADRGANVLKRILMGLVNCQHAALTASRKDWRQRRPWKSRRSWFADSSRSHPDRFRVRGRNACSRRRATSSSPPDRY